MTNVEALANVAYKPVSYENEVVYENKDNATDESIFTAEKTVKSDSSNENSDGSFFSAVGNFFASIGNFFSGIFKGIGNFFTGLFKKEENPPAEETTAKETDEPSLADDDKEDTTKPADTADVLENKTISDEIVKELDINTKDGEIGATSQSSVTGDCWLLSGINALSYTKEGRQIIKDTLEYKDGYTIVHLKGARDYIVEDKEVETTQYMEDYSTGDWDMVTLEIAAEKALKDITSGEVELPKDKFWNVQAAFESAEDSIDGGSFQAAFYLITGKEAEHYSHLKDDTINSGEVSEWNTYQYPGTTAEMLDRFEEDNGKSMAIGADWASIIFAPGTPFYVEDINGKYIPIVTSHGYAVKSAQDDNVVITNPWDSSKDITLKKETFLDIFKDFYLLDLSSN